MTSQKTEENPRGSLVGLMSSINSKKNNRGSRDPSPERELGSNLPSLRRPERLSGNAITNEMHLPRYTERMLTLFKEAFVCRNQAHQLQKLLEQLSQDPNNKQLKQKRAECELEYGLATPLELLQNSFLRVSEILKEGPNDFQALFFSAQVLYELSLVVDKQDTKFEHLENALKQAENASKTTLPPTCDLSNTWALISLINRGRSDLQRDTNDLDLSENSLIESAEALQKSLNTQPDNFVANELLSTLTSRFYNNPKKRERNGHAIYFIAGELKKQGGGYKNWKSRWLVCDDTSITYWHNKKEWENGPVCNKQGSPKGQILWNEIVDVTYHEGECYNIHNRPKTCTKLCLHLLTKSRTYNIIGFENHSQLAMWFKTVKRVSRLSKAKTYLKKQQNERYAFVQGSDNKLSVVESKRSSAIPQSANNNNHQANSESPSGESRSPFFHTQNLDFKVSVENIAEAIKRLSTSPVQTHTLDSGTDSERPISFGQTMLNLTSMDKELQQKLSKSVLKQLESEGLLAKLMSRLIMEDPSLFLTQIADVSDFSIARFGALAKIQVHLNSEPFRKAIGANGPLAISDDEDEEDEEDDEAILGPPPIREAPKLPSMRVTVPRSEVNFKNDVTTSDDEN